MLVDWILKRKKKLENQYGVELPRTGGWRAFQIIKFCVTSCMYGSVRIWNSTVLYVLLEKTYHWRPFYGDVLILIGDRTIYPETTYPSHCIFLFFLSHRYSHLHHTSIQDQILLDICCILHLFHESTVTNPHHTPHIRSADVFSLDSKQDSKT
jgi:hypothetical protein